MKRLLFFFLIISLYMDSYEKHWYHKTKKEEKSKKQKVKVGVIPCYSGGRFGDNLIAFSHSLYFAMKNHYKLLLVPFPYSDALMLDNYLAKYSPQMEYNFKEKVRFRGPSVFVNKKIESTLFLIPYFPESPYEYGHELWHSFPIDWNDRYFRNELRRLIKSKEPLHLITPPKDKISIAIHIRRGGSFNEEAEISSNIALLIAQKNLIYKMPVDDYYINQIKTVGEIFKETPLYVFLFTDDRHPEILAEKYMNELNNPYVEFDYRRSQNDHHMNVLEDFFSLLNFDILIRPESNFSIMAEKLGDHALVISPGKLKDRSCINEGIVKVQQSLDSLLLKKKELHEVY